MNKRAEELIRLNRKIRVTSFILFWVGVLICINGVQYVTDIYVQVGLFILVLSFFFFERANYHLGVLRGYHKGFTDAVRGHNYFVIYSPEDVEPERKSSKKK